MRFCPLWSLSLCFSLLETSQVTDFHRGLGFLVFSIAFGGPRRDVSSSFSLVTVKILAGSLQTTFTHPKLSCPCCPVPWQCCLHRTALLIVPFWVVASILHRCCRWNCTPGSYHGPSVARAFPLPRLCLEEQITSFSPKLWSKISFFGM